MEKHEADVLAHIQAANTVAYGVLVRVLIEQGALDEAHLERLKRLLQLGREGDQAETYAMALEQYGLAVSKLSAAR